MKVLVAGGAGYIGSHLVSALRQAGHAVRALDLRPPNDEHLAGPGLDLIQGSVADPSLVALAVQEVEVVFHLAWSFRTWRFYPELCPEEERREILENLFGTLNLLEAALAAGVRHLLFSGSAVVYGPTGPTQVDEGRPCHPERSTLGGPVYGITKLACEKLCLAYQQRGLPVTVFRLHGVFSEGYLNQFGQMIRQALTGESVRAIQGAGGEYIHMDDVLRAFLLAMDNPQAYGEVFNLAGSHTYSDSELARYIVEATGSKSQTEWIEDPAQGMISASVDRLRAVLGYKPERGEFLTALIRNSLGRPETTENIQK
jgi:UDP-glucose 4-epimerase